MCHDSICVFAGIRIYPGFFAVHVSSPVFTAFCEPTLMWVDSQENVNEFGVSNVRCTHHWQTPNWPGKISSHHWA